MATLVKNLSWTDVVGFVQVQRWRARLGLRILRRVRISFCGINIRKGLTAGLLMLSLTEICNLTRIAEKANAHG